MKLLPIFKKIIYLTVIGTTLFFSVNLLAQSIKLVIGKYDCFDDSECTNGYCDLQTHECIGCHGDQIMVDKECVCPDGTYTYGNYCISCDEPNEVYNGFGRCVCNEIADYHSIGGICQMCPDKQIWNGKNACICDDTQGYYFMNGDCQQCPIERKYWNGTMCVPCLISNHCAINQQCGLEQPYICSNCPSNLIRPQNREKCQCPSDMGLTVQNNGEPICLSYCPKNHKTPGIILIIDRSNSTDDAGCGASSISCDKLFDKSLGRLNIPYKAVDTAIFFGNGAKKSDAMGLSYKRNTYEDLSYYFKRKNRTYVKDVNVTSFSYATNEILTNICTGQKLIIILWSDDRATKETKDMQDDLSAIKKNCPNSLFYLVGPSNPFPNLTDKFFDLDKLDKDYESFLNTVIENETCLDPETNENSDIKK